MQRKRFSEAKVDTGLRLNDYAATPLYNIKAVVQATGISPSTLRAWERRYDIARPHRSESGYRLYSERDIAITRWLKAQVDAGMSISQAVTWLGKLIGEASEPSEAILPTAGNTITIPDSLSAIPGAQSDPPNKQWHEVQGDRHHNQTRNLATLRHELIAALLRFDEAAAEQTISEAFALYPFEEVGDKLFLPALFELDERRQQGDLTLVTQRFAGNYLLHRLTALLRAAPNYPYGPLIWLAHVDNPAHATISGFPEVEAMLYAVHLRRAGYHVHYLGQSFAAEEEAVTELVQEARRHQPALILFCASTPEAAEQLSQLASSLAQAKRLPATIGYCGSVYAHDPPHEPKVRAATAGVYLGATAKEITQNIGGVLSERLVTDRNRNSGNNGKRVDSKVDQKQDTKHDQPVHNGTTLLSKPW